MAGVQLGREVPLRCGEVVVHRLVQLALAAFGLKPGPGADVQMASAPGVVFEQAVVQHLAQEVMAAKPRPATIDRREQQRRAREPAEGAAGRHIVPEDARAEVRVEAIQHRRLEDEAPLVLGRRAQDLVGERPEEVLAADGELRHDLPDLVTEAQSQRRQVQRGRPALGAPLERRDVGRVERQAQAVAQEAQRLVVGEAQVVGAQVEHLALDAQAPERLQAEVATARVQDAVRARQPREDPVEAVAGGRVVEDEMQVVEDEHDRLGRAGERVEQRDQDAAAQVRIGRLGGIEGGIEAGSEDVAQRGQHGGPQARAAVVGVQRHPCDALGLGAALAALGEQRALSVARRGGDDDDPRAAGIDRVEQQRALDVLVAGGGPVELRLWEDGARIGAGRKRGRHRFAPSRTCRPRTSARRTNHPG